MRLTAAVPIGALAFLCVASPDLAQPRSSIQGFGGMRLGGFASNDASFGGVVTSELTPFIQVVGEGGRIGNILSPMIDVALGLAPGDLGFRTSAWYGQGGVRISTSGSGVRPYLETQAGIARLQTRVTGLGSGTAEAITNAALQFLDGTSPIATVGGGLTFSAGAFVTDVGYRYRRIFSDNWVNALSTGTGLDVNEIRIGVGVRF
jgi:opacity protein-like surface antigen